MSTIETTKPKVGIPDGYYPHQLRTLLDIDQSLYDYWKRELQPKLRHKLYKDGDVFAYLVMKEAIIGWELKVTWLKDVDWVMVFDACNDLPKSTLANYRFVFNRVSQEVLVLSPDEINPVVKKRSEIRVIQMDEIFEEFYENQQKGFPSNESNVVAEENLIVARLRKQSEDRRSIV
jgi:hypothetical protein